MTSPPKEIEHIQVGAWDTNHVDNAVYSIERRLYDYDSDVSHLREDELYCVIDELQSKLNDLIDAYNQLIKQDEKLSK